MLKAIFKDLNTADLVSVQIYDFVKLTELCQVKTEKSKQLDAELTIQRMVTLNQ